MRSLRTSLPLLCSIVALSGCTVTLELQLSREAVVFDDTLVGDADTQGVDVLMLQGGPADLEAWIEPTGAPFVIVAHPPAVLDQDQPTFVSVRFQPDITGQQVGVLVLRASNVQGTTRRDIALDASAFAGGMDADRDGHGLDADCDDGNATVYPGAPEICDGLDNDCDGLLPANESDFDGDGFSACAGDCSDDDETTYPEAAEICDGVDNDCDGDIGEDDEDGDGFRLCDGDCDDDNPLVRPGATELCDGLDTNCDGVLFDEELDVDGDGWRGCGGDCDDDDASIAPGIEELCDGVDQDCDGELPDDELDQDVDGFLACEECDDDVAESNPDASEICDGLDNDCDGVLPADESDGDSDGVIACADCDDSNPDTFPSAPELCDGEDNDCDTVLPSDEVDADSDGTFACEDCDDSNPDTFPLAPELCDGEDNDCDTVLPGDEVDGDLDGTLACADCDDTDPDSYPLAAEQCDEADNDCDGVIPDDELDDDGDGFVECAGDCDDTDPETNEGADEECFDAVDTDCDGTINQDCPCPIWGWTVAAPACTSFGSYDCPWPQAQLAIDSTIGSAVCGQTWLRPDTYVENLVIDGVVTVRGPGEASDVVLDGDGSGSTITVGDGSALVLEAVTVTGGEALEGGGMFAASADVELTGVVFEDNECDDDGLGGAIYFNDVSFDVEACLFEGNDCGLGGEDEGNDGGGIYMVDSGGTIEFSTFQDNTAGDGSALYIDSGSSFATIRNNAFYDNETADSDNPQVEIEGGAVVINSDNKTLANNLFGGNVGNAGGGALTVADQGSGTLVLNNVMLFNTSPQGAGIHFESFLSLPPAGTFLNNIVVFNTGYGVWTDITVWPANFEYNDVHGNSAGSYGSLFGGLLVPANNISATPQFIADSDDGDWTNDDFHLNGGSLCIDAGDPDPSFDDEDGTRNDQGIFGGGFGDWDGP